MSVFKPIEECIELFKQGVPCDTGFSYMYNCEEVTFDDDDGYEFNLNGDIKDQLDIIEEQGYSGPEIANDSQQPYAEFTQIICPAYKA